MIFHSADADIAYKYRGVTCTPKRPVPDLFLLVWLLGIVRHIAVSDVIAKLS